MNHHNDPAGSFQLRHDAAGRLVLIDAGGGEHEGVEPVRCFPMSEPDHWIAICDADGRELLVIDDLAALSPETRRVLEQDLARREFVPSIVRIIGEPADTEPAEWDVETDRGRVRFLVNNADDVRRLGSYGALIIDAQGIRYVVDDVRRLEPASRRILDHYLQYL